VPAEIVAKDLLRTGSALTVRIRSLEGRAVPQALFDLQDASAREPCRLPRRRGSGPRSGDGSLPGAKDQRPP